MDGTWACVSDVFLYLNVWQWAMGLIYHNTLPMFPGEGPFEPTFAESNIYLAKFTEAETILIMVLKLIGIGFWSLTIAKLIHAITVLGNPAAIAYQQDIDASQIRVELAPLPLGFTHCRRQLAAAAPAPTCRGSA